MLKPYGAVHANRVSGEGVSASPDAQCWPGPTDPAAEMKLGKAAQTARCTKRCASV